MNAACMLQFSIFDKDHKLYQDRWRDLILYPSHLMNCSGKDKISKIEHWCDNGSALVIIEDKCKLSWRWLYFTYHTRAPWRAAAVGWRRAWSAQEQPLSRKLLTSASELEPKDVSADVGKIINQPVIHGSCCLQGAWLGETVDGRIFLKELLESPGVGKCSDQSPNHILLLSLITFLLLLWTVLYF